MVIFSWKERLRPTLIMFSLPLWILTYLFTGHFFWIHVIKRNNIFLLQSNHLYHKQRARERWFGG